MKTTTLWMTFILFCMLLVACQPDETIDQMTAGASSPTPGEQSQAAAETAVAQTVVAELTQVAAILATDTPEPIPTDTSEPADTPTQEPTNTPRPSPTIEAFFDNHALFVTDVTIPDGTQIVAGETFTKTWRVQNIGRNTWTDEYTFVFINGERMEGQAINIPGEVFPGGSTDLSVGMIAPDDPGIYTGFWMLRAPETDEEEATLFGIGTEAAQALFVEIEVIPATPTPTATPEADQITPTATTQPGSQILNVSLRSDGNAFRGACPAEFNFSADITLTGPATVTYEIEASSEDSGVDFDVPGPQTTTSSLTGQHVVTVNYVLAVEENATGQVAIRVTSPNEVSSPPIFIAVTCEG